MAKEQNTLALAPIGRDISATFLVGLIAAPLSIIVATNLGIKFYWLLAFIIFIPVCVMGIVIARGLAKFLPIFYQLGKFAETGGLNFLMDLGIYNLLIFFTGSTESLDLAIFKAASFTVAVTNSYFWNKLWVFGKKEKTKEEAAKEFSSFIVVSLVGLAISAGVTFVVASLGGKGTSMANLAAVIAALSAMAWNFLGYKFIVFKK